MSNFRITKHGPAPQSEFCFLSPAKSYNTKIDKVLDQLSQNLEPLKFSYPVNQSSEITLVHTKHNPQSGGLFGPKARGVPHYGIDLKADIGQGVLSSEEGIVVVSEKLDGYGEAIYINHRNGYQTRYAHLSERRVKVGDFVLKNTLIGESGKTGNAVGDDILAHLHFEIRKIKEGASKRATSNSESEALDPMIFLQKNKSRGCD